MSNLVVVAFDEPHQAEEVRLKLQKLQSEYLLDLADMVVAVKDKVGKAKLHHAANLIADDMVFQSFCGSLASLIFHNATTGAASRALADVGINDSLHENVHVHANSWQFSAFRPHENIHTEQGPAVGRTEGARRQSLDDLAFAGGRI